MKELSRKGKISVFVGFFSIISAIIYIFIVMDGRTKATEKDNLFFMIVLIIASISLIITMVDKARVRGGEFSWKKLLLILLGVILFGLWRLSV
ncbi:hypothetical protein A6P54_20885 [Bacillus sp. MKU004]|nr:hypothetical protein A6P54_20885 [Bacillus sp. MKU004]